MIDSLKPYEKMKPSGMPWVGDIPSHWEVVPMSGAYSPNKELNDGMKQTRVLSLSYGRIVVRPPEKLVGLVPESFETYQVIRPGDVILRTTDLQNDRKSLRVGIAKDEGIITSAYLSLRPTGDVSPEFGFRYLQAWDTSKAIYGYGSGLRQSLAFEHFKRMPIPVPPSDEQQAIVSFLLHAESRINRAVAAKETMIGLLNERKQAIIHQAVTRGLDPTVPLKPSGLPWLGDIPAHWTILRGKSQFRKVSRTTLPTDETITCFRDGTVTLRRNRRLSGFTEALQEIGYQGIEPGDLVIHAMDAFAGAVGVSDSRGKASPVYSVCEPIEQSSPEYCALALRLMAHAGWIEALSTGIRERSTDFRYSTFGSQWLPVPPSDEQQAIVDFVDEQSRRIEIATSKLERECEHLIEYRARLTSDVVTGKLDVRGVAKSLAELDDEPSDRAEAPSEEVEDNSKLAPTP